MCIIQLLTSYEFLLADDRTASTGSWLRITDQQIELQLDEEQDFQLIEQTDGNTIPSLSLSQWAYLLKKWKWTVDIVKRSTRGLCEGRTQFLVIADSRSGRSRQRGKRKRFEQEINRDVINRLIQDQTRRSASDQIFEQLVITDWSDGAGNLINWLIWSINQFTNRKEIDRWIERSIGWSIERKLKSWAVVWVGSQFSSSSSRCLRTSTASTTSERQMFRTTARTRSIQN